MNNFLDIALRYHRAGLKIIPFSTNSAGEKVFPKEYARFRTSQTEQDVQALFSGHVSGICLLCTDNIEAVDIDIKHDPKGSISADLLNSMETFGLSMPGVVQKTKSGGFHLIYRCPQPEGNMKLARRSGEKEAMLETRGQGGLLFIYPTPGYEIQSGDLCDIPMATQEDRDYLIRMCRHFDEPEPVAYEKKVPGVAQSLPGLSPWQDYDRRTDILQLMEGYGWRIVSNAGKYIRLNRPGAKHSRGVDGSVIPESNLFYPFTSSEAFEPNKAYSPSGVYAMLEHGGDFREAARALYRQGFGDRIEKRADEQAQARQQLPELVQAAERTKFDPALHIEEPKALLRYEDFGFSRKIGGRGMVGVFTGFEKSGKSFVGSCIAASALAGGREVLNFSLDLDGGRMLWFDTEQSEYFYRKTQQRIYRMAGVERKAANYDAFHLRKLSAAQRLEVIEYYITNTPDLSVVMIDGFVDLIADYNDLKAAQEYVGRLLKWTDERRIMIMGVLHLNKGDGKIRGHLGSEIKNKCDFALSTLKVDGHYTVSNPINRYGEIEDFDFSRDDEGLPIYESNSGRRWNAPGPSTTFTPQADYATPILNNSRQEPDEDMPF